MILEYIIPLKYFKLASQVSFWQNPLFFFPPTFLVPLNLQQLISCPKWLLNNYFVGGWKIAFWGLSTYKSGLDANLECGVKEGWTESVPGDSGVQWSWKFWMCELFEGKYWKEAFLNQWELCETYTIFFSQSQKMKDVQAVLERII